jgi:hypothetical protein
MLPLSYFRPRLKRAADPLKKKSVTTFSVKKGKCEHYGQDAKIDVFSKSLRRKVKNGHLFLSIFGKVPFLGQKTAAAGGFWIVGYDEIYQTIYRHIYLFIYKNRKSVRLCSTIFDK